MIGTGYFEVSERRRSGGSPGPASLLLFGTALICCVRWPVRAGEERPAATRSAFDWARDLNRPPVPPIPDAVIPNPDIQLLPGGAGSLVLTRNRDGPGIAYRLRMVTP